MPRKTKGVEDAKAQPTLTENEPQPTLTDDTAAPTKPAAKDRGPGGQFAKGNPGGPGNPHARACARMLEVFRNAVSEEDMLRIVNKMIEKAANGDTSAAKLIVAYRIGKPLPGHHPDSIDRDEWDHYQKDAMNDKEMAVVMNALPTSVGNNVARISLPIMTAARTHDLAMKLREGTEDEGRGKGREPIANRKNSKSTVQPTTLHTPPATNETVAEEIDDGVAGSAAQHEGYEEVETSEEQLTEKSEPLSNGKKSKRIAQRGATEQPLSNGKMNAKAGSPTNEPPIQRSTNHDSRSTTKKTTGKKMCGKKIRKAKAIGVQPLAKQLVGSCGE